MVKDQQPQPAPAAPEQPARGEVERPPYEPPRLLKKRSLARTTLFIGSGPDGGGVAATG